MRGPMSVYMDKVEWKNGDKPSINKVWTVRRPKAAKRETVFRIYLDRIEFLFLLTLSLSLSTYLYIPFSTSIDIHKALKFW